MKSYKTFIKIILMCVILYFALNLYTRLIPLNPDLNKLKTPFNPKTSELRSMYNSLTQILQNSKLHVEKQTVFTHNYKHEKITLYYLKDSKLTEEQLHDAVVTVCNVSRGIKNNDTFELVRIFNGKNNSENLKNASSEIESENTCEFWKQFPVNIQTTPYITPWK